MTTFILTNKKIKIETDKKEIKKAIKKLIKETMSLGFDKNTAKANLLYKLLKNKEFQEKDKKYIFPELTIEDIESCKVVLEKNIEEE